MDRSIVARVLEVDINGIVIDLCIRLHIDIAVFDLNHDGVNAYQSDVSWRAGLDCVNCTCAYLLTCHVVFQA